ELEPLPPALARAPHRVQVPLLDLERNRPDAELVVVDGPQRRHLGGGAAHEHLVREIEVGADQLLLHDLVAEILRDLLDRVARDPGQDPGGEVGRREDAVADDEDVLAGAVGDEALRREQDRLVVAGAVRLGHGQHRVDVDPGRLGDVRDHVRRDALPRGDLRGDAAPQPLLAEVRAPRPAHDHGLDGVVARGDTQLAEAVERDRAHVALRQAVRGEELVRGGLELVDGERELHVQEASRVVQAPHVIGEAEHGRTLRRLVAADALEDARAVVEAVGADVNPSVVPVDELAVHPDLLGGLQRRLLSPGRAECYPGATRSTLRACASRWRSDGDSAAMWYVEPAPIQTTLCWSSVRSSTARTPGCWGNGATAPGSKPVARSTSEARAMRADDAPSAAATLLSSARRSPGTSASAYAPSQTKTSDLTIWPTAQPTARAAAPAGGVPSGNSWMCASTAAT